MERSALEELQQRIAQMEQLTWSIFRALETYITFNELQGKREGGDGDNLCVDSKTRTDIVADQRAAP